MGFNQKCQFQTCEQGCCNYYGQCPEDYSEKHYSNYYTRCYHYYEEQTPGDRGEIIAYLVLGVGVVILLLTLLYRKKRQAQKRNILSQINHSIFTQNPYNPQAVSHPHLHQSCTTPHLHQTRQVSVESAVGVQSSTGQQ